MFLFSVLQKKKTEAQKLEHIDVRGHNRSAGLHHHTQDTFALKKADTAITRRHAWKQLGGNPLKKEFGFSPKLEITYTKACWRRFLSLQWSPDCIMTRKKTVYTILQDRRFPLSHYFRFSLNMFRSCRFGAWQVTDASSFDHLINSFRRIVLLNVGGTE